MKHWEKAFENYMLADFTADEEERELLLEAAAKYVDLELANSEFFEHPLFKRIVVGMAYRHEEELKEAFQAGWSAYQHYLGESAAKRKHRILSLRRISPANK